MTGEPERLMMRAALVASPVVPVVRRLVAAHTVSGYYMSSASPDFPFSVLRFISGE